MKQSMLFRSARSAARHVAPLVASVLLVAAFMLSPLSLLLLNRININWERLSLIGQSYTAPAALLSAAALIGLVLTVRVQSKQTQITQLHAVRSLQIELSLFAIQNPDMLALYGFDVDTDERKIEAKKRLFRIILMRYLQLSFIVGDTADSEVALIMEHDFFRDESGLQWWREVEVFWRAQAVTREAQAFVDLVSRGAAEAESRMQRKRDTPSSENG